MRLLAAAATALALASPAAFLESRRLADGAFAETGGRPGAALTAWATLGLRAVGRDPGTATLDYLGRQQPETVIETALVALALGTARNEALLARLRAAVRPGGAIGPTVNSTVWSTIALGGAVAPRTVRYLLSQQAPSGGWSWLAGGRPDSNDTAAAIEALRAARVSGRPIARAVAFLRRLQNRDGGFELTAGRGSDAQSTAWAIQALIAAGRAPGREAYGYLARLRKDDGSYRYSIRYVTTPVWVTAQVLPALAGKPFPLR